MDIEIRWSDNVNEARSLVSNSDKHQMRIAELCLESVNLKRGGSSKIQEELDFTVDAFALDVGVSVKSLYNWIDFYRSIYSKLDKDMRDKVSLTAVSYIHRKVGPKASKQRVQEETAKFLDRKDETYKIIAYVSQVRSLHTNLVEKGKCDRVEDELLSLILFLSEDISRVIKEDHRNIKPKDTRKSRRITKKLNPNSSPVPGIYETEEGIDVKLTDKDIDVYSHLRRCASKRLTARQIGLKLTSGKTETAARLWARRSLEKLNDLGWIEKSKDGRYVSEIRSKI